MGSVGPLVGNTSADQWLAERNRNKKTYRGFKKELNKLVTHKETKFKGAEVLGKEGSFKKAAAGQKGCLERKGWTD